MLFKSLIFHATTRKETNHFLSDIISYFGLISLKKVEEKFIAQD
jgi:hypothetical protein